MAAARTYRRRSIAALALLVIASLTAPSTATTFDETCRGPKDETELADSSIRVVAAKRERFLADVRDYAARASLGVGSATDEKGWIVLLLESRPWGVTIEVEAMDADNFRAVARTCNAAQDWRPYWNAFKQFIDAHRADWRE